MSKVLQLTPWSRTKLGPQYVHKNAFLEVLKLLQDYPSERLTYLYRGRIDWSSGDNQEPYVSLAGGNLVTGGELDPSLEKARRARVYVRTADGGNGRFGLSDRQFEAIHVTPELEELARQINTILYAGRVKWTIWLTRALPAPLYVLATSLALYFVVTMTPAYDARKKCQALNGETSALCPEPPIVETLFQVTAVLFLVSLVAFIVFSLILLSLHLASRPFSVVSPNLRWAQIIKNMISFRNAHPPSRAALPLLRWILALTVAAFIGGYINKLFD